MRGTAHSPGGVGAVGVHCIVAFFFFRYYLTSSFDARSVVRWRDGVGGKEE